MLSALAAAGANDAEGQQLLAEALRLDASAPVAAPAAQKVTVSGGKNVRIPLRPEAAEGGVPIVQLPGGMSLTVVEVDGLYVKVATVDGKEGYLLKKEVAGLK